MWPLSCGHGDWYCEVRIQINSPGSFTSATPSTMSSSHVNASNGSPSDQHYSVFNEDPSFVPYPIVSKTLRDGTMGSGRPCELCGRVIRLGAKGSLHAYNMHVEACQKKTLKSTSTPSDRAASLSVAPLTSTAAVSVRDHRSPSLSPLTIGRHLPPSLSPTPSPTYSPTSPLTSVFFDVESDGDAFPPAPVQVIPTDTNPTISINPPSDDLQPPAMALYSHQPHQATPGTCPGVSVEWTPGTIWETYPFPSHSFVNHPWDIIEFRPPSHLCLRSKHCTGVISTGGYATICNHCSWIPQCEAYKTLEKRAHSAQPHTPHHLLAFRQLSNIPKILRKMLNEARLKVIKITRI
jgi:hypothetical protein